jgi:hypothetical protein
MQTHSSPGLIRPPLEKLGLPNRWRNVQFVARPCDALHVTQVTTGWCSGLCDDLS